MGTKKVSSPTVYQAEVKEDPNTKELYFWLAMGVVAFFLALFVLGVL